MSEKLNTYIISYDAKDIDDYSSLYNAIKSFGAWAHITESTWAVVSSKKAVDIRNEIGVYLPDESRLFVIKSGVPAAWRNVICSNEWLKKHL